MAVNKSNLDSAHEFLRSLSLDEDIFSYLCSALDDCIDLDSSERQDCFKDFLGREDLNKLLVLLSHGKSQSTAACASTAKCTYAADGKSESAAACASTANCTQQTRTTQADESALLTQGEKSQSKALHVSTKKARAVRLDKFKSSVDNKGKSDSSADDSRGKSGVDNKSKSVVDKRNGGVDGKDKNDSSGDEVGLDFEVCGARENVRSDTLVDAGSIKTTHYVLIKGQACKVIQVKKGSKVWKGPYSGCFQSQIVARCIFTERKFEHICPESQKVTMPFVSRQEYTVLDIGEGGELELLTASCETKSDLNLPRETSDDLARAEAIRADFNASKTVVVTVVSACGIEKVVKYKASA